MTDTNVALVDAGPVRGTRRASGPWTGTAPLPGPASLPAPERTRADGAGPEVGRPHVWQRGGAGRNDHKHLLPRHRRAAAGP